MDKIDVQYHAVIQLAKEVGALQKTYFRSKTLQIGTKSTTVDMVTEADLACDHLIVNQLKMLFPNDDILSEEQGANSVSSANKSAYNWIIDPLDGTTNFSIGHPIFAVSIARWHNEEPEFGVVYVPMLDELFYAQAGRGAYMNHEQISCSICERLDASVIGTGFPYDRATAVNNNAKNIAQMVPRVKGLRRLGAAAYDLCLVAAGIYDGFWELRLAKWDMAAGWLMIKEAGGAFLYTVENDQYNVIAGSKEICNQLKAIVCMDNNKGGDYEA